MTYGSITGYNKKGVMLFMVLSTIMIIVALANVILVLVTSHSRLTRHQTGRIQAFYAAQAGINYAMEMLRTGTWTPPAAGTLVRTLCRGACAAPNISNSGLPFDVTLTIYPVGFNPPGPAIAQAGVAPIDASVTYTTPQ